MPRRAALPSRRYASLPERLVARLHELVLDETVTLAQASPQQHGVDGAVSDVADAHAAGPPAAATNGPTLDERISPEGTAAGHSATEEAERATAPTAPPSGVAWARAVFDGIDVNGSGSIDRAELFGKLRADGELEALLGLQVGPHAHAPRYGPHARRARGATPATLATFATPRVPTQDISGDSLAAAKAMGRVLVTMDVGEIGEMGEGIGQISWEEFEAAVYDAQLQMYTKAVFTQIDADGSGVINRQELQAKLQVMTLCTRASARGL